MNESFDGSAADSGAGTGTRGALHQNRGNTCVCCSCPGTGGVAAGPSNERRGGRAGGRRGATAAVLPD